MFCAPRYPKSIALFGGLQALPVYTPDHGIIQIKIRVGHLADYHEKVKAKVQREKPVPLIIYPPQITNRLARVIFWGQSCERTGFLS